MITRELNPSTTSSSDLSGISYSSGRSQLFHPEPNLPQASSPSIADKTCVAPPLSVVKKVDLATSIPTYERYKFDCRKEGARLYVSYELAEMSSVIDVVKEIELRYGVAPEGRYGIIDPFDPYRSDAKLTEVRESGRLVNYYIDFSLNGSRKEQSLKLSKRSEDFAESWMVVLGAALYLDQTRFESIDLFRGALIRTLEGMLQSRETGIGMFYASHERSSALLEVPAVIAAPNSRRKRVISNVSIRGRELKTKDRAA